METTRRAIQGGAKSTISEMLGGNLSQLNFRIVLEAAERGDAVALEQIKRGGEAFGKKIAFLVNLLNPELIVIGGGVSNNEKYLFPTIKAVIKKRAMSLQGSIVKIKRAKFGDDAGIIGAQVLVYNAKKS